MLNGSKTSPPDHWSPRVSRGSLRIPMPNDIPMNASRTLVSSLRLGIDATNLRSGGGLTHLRELLAAAKPAEHGFSEIVVWGGRAILAHLPERVWLRSIYVGAADRSLFARLFWQRTQLDKLARDACDVLLIPGGLYVGTFRPFVAVCQNLLPFDSGERRRYGLSPMRVRLDLLSHLQASTFRRADGVIFLTETAKRTVESHTHPLELPTAVIPHGVARGFFRKPGSHLTQQEPDRSFRWSYVSIVDMYKHQDKVVEAVAILRARGIPVVLELIGPAYPPALRRLRRVMGRVDPSGEFVRYVGAVPYAELPRCYHRADGFVFASTCENMPNILLEAMAASLPIVCSNRGVMGEVLGDAGIQCDPERVDEIADAMMLMMRDPALRSRCATQAFERARAYSWERCAGTSLAFIASCARQG